GRVSKGGDPALLLPITARGLPRAIETPRSAQLLRMRLVLVSYDASTRDELALSQEAKGGVAIHGVDRHDRLDVGPFVGRMHVAEADAGRTDRRHTARCQKVA